VKEILEIFEYLLEEYEADDIMKLFTKNKNYLALEKL
jgi:hypothetical protein